MVMIAWIRMISYDSMLSRPDGGQRLPTPTFMKRTYTTITHISTSPLVVIPQIRFPLLLRVRAGLQEATLDYFYQMVHRENDQVNFIQSGRFWYGDEFRTQNIKTFDHNFSNVRTDLPGLFSHQFVARSIGDQASCQITLNGTSWYSQTFFSVPGDYDETFGYIGSKSDEFDVTGNSVSIRYTYNPRSGEGNAWIGYYSLAVPTRLTLSGNQTVVRSHEAVDYSNVKYQFESSGYNVWDVTSYFNSAEQQFYQEDGKNTTIKYANQKAVEFALFNEGAEIQAEYVFTGNQPKPAWLVHFELFDRIPSFFHGPVEQVG